MFAARRVLSTTKGVLGKPYATQVASSFSTAAHTAENPEMVTVLRLNNLYDNPGAVKKVSLDC